jgi:Ni2+-binding GTPase involved in maturation of urease and hydrogenase
MRLTVVSGPPSAGKTSVILQLITQLRKKDLSVGVVKFDCLYTEDDALYRRAGVKIKKGLAGALCPDHFFAANIEEAAAWSLTEKVDFLITESAGLCNRCSPYISTVTGVCVLDNLSGMNTPRKIGPLLKAADIAVITKGDVVSQAEREVFAARVSAVNPRAAVIEVNGLTGHGARELARLIADSREIAGVRGLSLRFAMPAGLCSYCLGETRIGREYQLGNLRKIDFGGE